jgi:hypothetical protein
VNDPSIAPGGPATNIPLSNPGPVPQAPGSSGPVPMPPKHDGSATYPAPGSAPQK